MQRRNLIILGAALLFGLIAVFLANTYFSGFEKQEAAAAKEQQLARIVVASQALAFGAPLTPDNVRLVNWPENSVPPGAFRAIPDALRDGRVALRPIAVGEPILAERVSGADGRASISYNLPEDMRAISIPVSAVTGVSGFVTPGDVVDVLLTRQIPGGGDGDRITDVLMENIQVLAIDQMANDKATNPKVGKTAVLMVDMFGAQKLTLARETGTLSLALRNIKNQSAGYVRTVSARDLSRSGLFIRARPAAAPPAPAMPPASTQLAVRRAPGAIIPTMPMGPSMVVVRGTQVTSYEVKSNGGW